MCRPSRSSWCCVIIWCRALSRQSAIAGIAALVAIGVLFIAAQFWGSLAVPEAEFVSYLQGRMADPREPTC